MIVTNISGYKDVKGLKFNIVNKSNYICYLKM